MIENIVFDVGRVLVGFEPEEIVTSYISTRPDIALVTEALFYGPFWPMLDDGSGTEESILPLVCQQLPERLHPKVAEILENWHHHLVLLPEIQPVIRELHERGLRLYLLTNFSRSFYKVQARHDFFKLFQGAFVSAEHRLVKPDPLIYQAFFKEFSLQPETCFFIDDREENILAAAALGMRGHIYQRDTDALKADLEKAMNRD